MARTPPNERNDSSERSQSQGMSWPLIIGVIVIVLFILYLLLGNAFSTGSVEVEEEAVETTQPQDADDTSGQSSTADAAGTDASGSDSNATLTGTDTGSDAQEGTETDASAETEGDDVEVIDVEEDAEVEILDDT